MTVGYDADVIKIWGMAGGNNLRNHGKSLAFGVSDRRREPFVESGPSFSSPIVSEGSFVNKRCCAVEKATKTLRRCSDLHGVSYLWVRLMLAPTLLIGGTYLQLY